MIKHRKPPFKTLIVMIGMSLIACSSQITPSEHAEKGYLDLRECRLCTGQTVRLDGEWEFYWEQLLTSEDFQSEPEPELSAYASIPGVWRGIEVDGYPLPGKGYGTYRLTVDLPQSDQEWGIWFRQFGVSGWVWINGELIATNGTVGTNRESYAPEYLSEASTVWVESNRMEVIVQVANFDYRKGGIWQFIQLGSAEFVQRKQEISNWLDLILLGGLLFLGLYQLGIYFLRKTNISALFLGLFTMVVALRQVSTGQSVITRMIPDISWENVVRFEFLGFYAGAGMLIAFLHLLFRKRSVPVVSWILVGIYAIYSIIVIATPVRIFNETIASFYIFAVLGIAYSIYMLINAIRMKEDGAGIILIGFGVFALTLINDTLYAENAFNALGYIGSLGVLFLVLSQSLSLSTRVMKAFVIVEELSKSLERKVIKRTEELSHKSELLEQKNRMMEDDLNLARKIQMKMIPTDTPLNEIAFYYKPMFQVGGDFFDFVPFPDGRLGLFISDVSGHGVPAAFVTSMIKSYLFQSENLADDPARFLLNLNQFLHQYTAGNFVTAFYGIYDPQTRGLTFANAGHNCPFVITEESVSCLSSTKKGMPLAVLDNENLSIFNKSFTNETLTLQKNTKLLLYTDGLVEAVNYREKQRNPHQAIEDFETSMLLPLLSMNVRLPSKDYVDLIIHELIEFRGKDDFDDDVCLIAVDVE